MTRFGKVALAGIGTLALLLLFADLQTAYTSEHVDSQQTIMSAKGTPGVVGNKLTVYLSGDRALAGALRKQLAVAARAKELDWNEFQFVDTVPQETGDNPFLAIHVDEDKALWTPFFATRKVKAAIVFAQGRAVDRDSVSAPWAQAAFVEFKDGPCVGKCSEGRRNIELAATTMGLVSLPHARSLAAGKVAAEAVTLMVAGLPPSFASSRWSDRATELAGEIRGSGRGTWSAMFQRVAACRGGVLMTEDMAPGTNWSVMYYDASLDAITGTVTASDVQAKLPGSPPVSTHGFGATPDGRSIHIGSGLVVTIPVGTCGLSGWQVTTY